MNNNHEEEPKEARLGSLRVYAIFFGSMFVLICGYLIFSNSVNPDLEWVVVLVWFAAIMVFGLGISPFLVARFSGARIKEKEYAEPTTTDDVKAEGKPTTIKRGATWREMWSPFCMMLFGLACGVYGFVMFQLTQIPWYPTIGVVGVTVAFAGVVWLYMKVSHEEEVIQTRYENVNDAIDRFIHYMNNSRNHNLVPKPAYVCELVRSGDSVVAVLETEDNNEECYTISMLNPENYSSMALEEIPDNLKRVIDSRKRMVELATYNRVIRGDDVPKKPKKEEKPREKFEGEERLRESLREMGVPEYTV